MLTSVRPLFLVMQQKIICQGCLKNPINSTGFLLMRFDYYAPDNFRVCLERLQQEDDQNSLWENCHISSDLYCCCKLLVQDIMMTSWRNNTERRRRILVKPTFLWMQLFACKIMLSNSRTGEEQKKDGFEWIRIILLQCFSKRFRSIYIHKNGPDIQAARPIFWWRCC